MFGSFPLKALSSVLCFNPLGLYQSIIGPCLSAFVVIGGSIPISNHINPLDLSAHLYCCCCFVNCCFSIKRSLDRSFSYYKLVNISTGSSLAPLALDNLQNHTTSFGKPHNDSIRLSTHNLFTNIMLLQINITHDHTILHIVSKVKERHTRCAINSTLVLQSNSSNACLWVLPH